MTQPTPGQGFPPPRGDAPQSGFTSAPPIINGTPHRGRFGKRPTVRGTLFGLRPGQLVAAQIAIIALCVTMAVDSLWFAASVPVALILLILAFGRVRGRWVYQWVGRGTGFFGRRISLPEGTPASTFLEALRPGATTTSIEVDGIPTGIITDANGLTSVLEVGNTTNLLTQSDLHVPSLGSLLPSAAADQPTVRLQLLLTGIAAPALTTQSAAASNSYRQLTDGRVLSQQRVLIAVHVRRSDHFTNDGLQRTLSSAVRRVRRRLDRVTLPCRALAGDSLLQALGEVAHHDLSHPVRENWSSVDIGGMQQACLQVTHWPDLRSELTPTIFSRLLTLQGGSTAISLSIERSGPDLASIHAELLIRLAAASQAELTRLTAALQMLVGSAGAHIKPLDGTQMDALTATLPLGGTAGGTSAMLAGVVAGSSALGSQGSGIPIEEETLACLEIPVGGAGLMLGVNRHGDPVTVRLFRPEPTRAAVIGGLRCAQVIVLRALAIGAEAIVLSGRPQAWEPFLRGVCAQGSCAIAMAAPGRILDPAPATPIRPQLLIVDVGPVGTTGIPVVEAAWRTTLLIRDDLGQSDIEILARTDLALIQPLTPNEAYFASAAFGLGDSAAWLTRIRADMIGLVVGRRTLRWALISATQLEHNLIGQPTR